VQPKARQQLDYMHNRFLPALHRDSKRAMETRSKAAAAAASLIPFSCCCCFDEFNLTDRTPMVLPCGHTYVCGKCTKRLNRCMECREPLFVTGVLLQKTSGNPVSTAPGTQNRGGYSPQPQTPDIHRNLTTAAEKIMLPIPKNLLLMSLMEAAQRQTRVDHAFSKESDEQSTGSSVLDDDEEYNLDKIISGISTLSGPCGTYAVKGDIELAVVPVDPTTQSNDDEKNVDELNVDSTLLLHSGQTVQVVNFQHGVAKLARGTGYIVATSNELVKGKNETFGLFSVKWNVALYFSQRFPPPFAVSCWSSRNDLSLGRFARDGRKPRKRPCLCAGRESSDRVLP
jgi:hypothetical protein